jgi:TM2 domain-containing membrane protein YozV
MFPNVRCPHCQTAVVNDANVAGKVVTCPTCHRTFQMPSAAAGPMAAPAYSSGAFAGAGAKSSGLAAVLSFFWTGLGQIYNGQILLGLSMMGAQFVFALLCLILIGIPFTVVLWVWSIYHAYNTAEAINRGQNPA